MFKEEIAKGRFKLALEIHDFAVKHPDCYMPRSWDELPRDVQENYLQGAKEDINLIKSNLPDMSEEEINNIAYIEGQKEGFDDDVGYKRIRPVDYVRAGYQECQSKLKEMLNGNH